MKRRNKPRHCKMLKMLERRSRLMSKLLHSRERKKLPPPLLRPSKKPQPLLKLRLQLKRKRRKKLLLPRLLRMLLNMTRMSRRWQILKSFTNKLPHKLTKIHGWLKFLLFKVVFSQENKLRRREMLN